MGFMKKKIVCEYNPDTKSSFSIRVKKRLISKKSKYQTIKIYQSEKFGNVLMIDGCFMFTEKDHHFYHSKCSELITGKKVIRNILIIGGGDFGLVKQLSSRKNIQSITLVEIDKVVTDSCKDYFPNFFNIKKSFMKKINVFFDDGYDWVKDNDKQFDLVIVDTTDPVGCAKKLFTKRFYKYVFNVLNINGIYIQQSGSPLIHHKKIIEPMIKDLGNVGFKNITINPFIMPSYPLGAWSFMRCERRSN